MDISPLTSALSIIAMLGFLALRSEWYLPWRARKEKERLMNIFNAHCPERLMTTLETYHKEGRGTFNTLDEHGRRALSRAFGDRGLTAGMELLSQGETAILLHTEEELPFQWLFVIYKRGSLHSLSLSKPFNACTMLPEC